MKNLNRLFKLEARLRPLSARYPPPAFVGFVSGDGELLDAYAIEQLSNSVPFWVEGKWLREPEEDMDTFIARVTRQAPPGALLVCARTNRDQQLGLNLEN